ncbi:hypothetical protein NSK11_contig00181-0011 [Nocardia seriolae]|uniref:Smf/DprA SLOG domain-containing protein n=1 Tax=Nocardia seriolae TaxID=37332 RepID=A0ABC9Z4H6_9NOCA|nr:hypothetical protein NSER024013_17550 [Nocardia seriolae]GAM50842.1 hypothetical protein NS07_v2contig00178-0011 [Nocardia seriolae]GAP32802.1 hypothetical protein NSK11_contig00181-0011 [Nocardia seriolae]
MTSTCIDRVAWALLARAASGPCAPLVELVDRVGATDAAAAVESGDPCLGLAPAVLERGRSFDAAARDLDEADLLGARLVTPEDPEWPRELLACLPTGSDNPGDAAPLAFWVRGQHSLRQATARAAALTGATASTDYGRQVTRSFGTELAAAGWTVVSGAAFGIDTVAHEAALAVDGLTVAIMPCGLDRAYPIGNTSMLAEIAGRGLIVSEYPFGARPHRYALLDRNRLLAALSSATVATEAGLRSGASSTMRCAGRFQRPVFAVPGPVTSAASQGCHRFIADGSAQLMTCARDVLQALTVQGDSADAVASGVTLSRPAGVPRTSVGFDRSAMHAPVPDHDSTLVPVQVISSCDDHGDHAGSSAPWRCDGRYPVWSESGEVRDWVVRLVSLLIETFNHRRDVDQFASMLDPKVRAALVTRTRSTRGRHRLATLHTCRLSEDIVEFCATIWVSTADRSLHALALAGRMERRTNTWVCTVLRPPGPCR